MGWLEFIGNLIVKAPIEKFLFPEPNRAKDMEQFLKTMPATEVPAAKTPVQTSPVPTTSTPQVESSSSPTASKVDLPTHGETTRVLKRRLAKELYKAELDLASGLLIADKPCDCLDVKHTLFLEATSEELIPQEPDNTVYREIIQWIKDNQHKVTIEAIRAGTYKEEYPGMAAKFKEFRKRVMGTTALSAMVATEETFTLEDAKKIAAAEAEKEVERQWKKEVPHASK